MRYFETERLHIKSWCNELEAGAMVQIRNLALFPFAYHHIAIMPDCHQGYGMPIGGVMASLGAVVPNAVGVDIGCGMCAVKTSLTEINTDTLKIIMGKIREAIPVGFNHHKEKQDINLMPLCNAEKEGNEGNFSDLPIIEQEYNSALKQLGTLGGGNHFIEIQKGSDGYIWIMIHSGSRNIGLKVAKHYNDIAIKFNERWRSSVPKGHELAFLPIETDEAKSYLKEMQYCVDFALANRKLMMSRIKDIFETETKCECVEPINIAHNYAIWENHFGKNVLVHRKGATLAREGTIGIIPGSQGTKSYIVKGKGNPDSFNSCSHGAGRRMGRKQATRELVLADEIKKLNDQNIIHSIRNIQDLDEASGAYKPIDEVMKEQEDLVEILVELQPLAVVKG